jgi:hypothetical protein
MSAAKFWVALIMAFVAWLRAYTGFDLGIDDATAAAIVGAITAGLVWLVPNKQTVAPAPDYHGDSL